MSMFRRLFLIAFSGLAMCGNLWAQTPDSLLLVRGELLDVLKDHMSAIKVDEVDDMYKAFEKIYSGGAFTDEEVDRILRTTTEMLMRRMNPNPIFTNYLGTLIVLKNGQHPKEMFFTWHDILDQVTLNLRSGQAKPFQEFVGFSRYFFESKALRYANNRSSTSWYALTDTYTFDFRDGVPLVSFDELDLMASSRRDSIFIKETSGSYFPVDQRWDGQGGKVDWTRYGWSDDVYAELSTYSFLMHRSLYEASNVRLHMPIHVGTQVIEGDLSDKLIANNQAVVGSYPRFTSYGGVMELENIGEGIKFKGGIRLQGPIIYGFAAEGEKASVQILDDKDKLLFKAQSDEFRIRQDESLGSEGAEATFYFGKDSIYHPSINVRFDIPRREMELSRGERGSQRYPFFSSLHNVNIDTDNIYAYLDRDSVIIGAEKISIVRNDETFFESINYYDPQVYQRYQNIATYNPIAIMKATAEHENTRIIDANLLAYRINSKFTVENIQTLLHDLAEDGFILYDSENQDIEVMDKVFHYVNAAQGKVDYDYLNIRSSTDSINAVLDLRDSSISMRGIRGMEFSKRQRVAVVPNDQQMKLRNNRNMSFGGKLYAGYTIMEGSSFLFDYENFRIVLDSIGYFQLFVPTGELDPNGDPIAYAMNSRIGIRSGLLQIDAPNNKSGKEDIEMFPSFRSDSNAYVVFESAQDSAYHRDSFYFETGPFNLDQLDAFVPPDIAFKGKLVSSGIFPDIPETLVLQDDYSLGFEHTIGEPGLPIYDNRGTYSGELSLNNRGLTGRGTMKYLWSTVQSDDLVFLPHELRSTADLFQVEEDLLSDIQVPSVQGQDIAIQWLPALDSMYVRSENGQFDLFGTGDHTLTGTLVLTPNGIRGDGSLDWSKAKVQSKDIAFGARSAVADTANLAILAGGTEEQVALSTSQVLAELNFDEQQGRFRALGDTLNTVLPYNQFETSINAFDWDMAGETITFQADPASPGKFVSIRPDQDSLSFTARNAFYDLSSNQLRCGGIDSLIAADAFIFPDSGKVDIQPEGIIATLENAQIVADTTSQLHVINRATVNILGRKEYTASGYYSYPIGDREQEILFQNIVGTRVGKGLQSEKQVATRATGEVSDSANFYIDNKMLFQGTISLESESSQLQFDGFARLDAEKLPQRPWFSLRSPGDKQDLTIAYDRPMTYDGQPVETGIFLSRETANIYPSVMAPLGFRRDRPILPVTGVFKYDESNDVFLFGDSSRVIEDDPLGTLMTFDNKDGSVYAEGPLNIGSGLQYINIDAVGNARTSFPPVSNVITDQEESLVTPDYMPVEMEMMAGVNMRIPEDLLVVLAQDIISSSFDADNINYRAKENFFKRSARQLFPSNPEVEYAIQSISSGYLDIPTGFNPYDLVFSDLQMRWDPDYQSFVAEDPEKVGVLSIHGQPVHKVLKCYVEFRMPTNEDDRVYIYLTSPSDLYYFFGYNKGILSITSNSPRFMDELLDLKKRDLIQEMDDGETFEIQVVEPSTARMFLRRMEALNEDQ